MTRRQVFPVTAGALCAVLIGIAPAFAQVFGTFTWQMQPYCNVVTLTLTSTPAGFALDGTDNQCGATHTAGVTGFAAFNAGGTVTLNFTIVTSAARTVQVSATVSPTTGSGTWTDSVGNSGAMALAANTGGAPRPLPASGLAAGIITTVEIAPSAVGGSDINTAEVQARVSGACPAGQAISAINPNGTVTCEPVLTTVSISGAAFVAEGLDSISRPSGGCAANQTDTSSLHASFQLPIGYQVTGASARIIDSSVGSNASLTISQLDGFVVHPLVTLATTGNPGLHTVSGAVAAPQTVSTGNAVYAIFNPGVSGSTLQVCSVELTLTKP